MSLQRMSDFGMLNSNARSFNTQTVSKGEGKRWTTSRSLSTKTDEKKVKKHWTSRIPMFGLRGWVQSVTGTIGVHNQDTINLLASIGAVALWGTAAITALGTLGVDTKPIIAGLGVSGATIGLAAKDSISNMISGIVLILNNTVKRGARITIVGKTGTVKKIDTTKLILIEDDGSEVVIPTAKVVNQIIVIHSESKL